MRVFIHRTLRIVLVVLIFSVPPSQAQEAASYFKGNCASCHTIGGGKLVGPDLRDVSTRAAAAGKDREWMIGFIADPAAVLASGDAYAQKILADARGVAMPKVAGMNRELAAKLLDYIDVESGKEPSASAAGPRLLTSEAAEEGRRIFTGERVLAGGGAGCISCHTLEGLRDFGGGLLGPDLTEVYSRLGGERGLAAWLSSPASPTMKPMYGDQPFKDDEITMLVSFFKSTAERKDAAKSAVESSRTIDSLHDGASAPGYELFNSTMTFLIIGLIATVCALVTMDWIWRRRFRAVREPMVHGQG